MADPLHLPGDTSAIHPADVQVPIPSHPLADLIPWHTAAEFGNLIVDVKNHGLRVKIVRFQGAILDGRGRYRACVVAGVEPEFREFDPEAEGDPAAFVASMNLHCRHLNESQRAMAAARLADWKLGQNQHARGGCADVRTLPPAVSQADAAAVFGVGKRTVQAAAEVIRDGVPELVEAVDKGAVAVSAAAELASLPPAEQAEVVKQGPKAVKKKAGQLRNKKKSAGQLPFKEKKSRGKATEPAPVSMADAYNQLVPPAEGLVNMLRRSLKHRDGAVAGLRDAEERCLELAERCRKIRAALADPDADAA